MFSEAALLPSYAQVAAANNLFLAFQENNI